MTERVMGVKDELGAVVAELGSGIEVPGGPYINVWSGLGLALGKNQAVASLMGRISQQVRAIAGTVNQASQKANQASVEVAGVRSQVVQVSKQQRHDEVKVQEFGCHLMQLTQLLVHVQQEVQQCKNVTAGESLPSSPPPHGAVGSYRHSCGICGVSDAIRVASCAINVDIRVGVHLRTSV
jgi:hypothetical protein